MVSSAVSVAALFVAGAQVALAAAVPPALFSAPLHGMVRRPSYKTAAHKAVGSKSGRGKGPGSLPPVSVPAAPGTPATGSKATGATTQATTTLAGVALDQEYVANITIGGQQFTVIVDTGSSDTWVVETGFSCIGLDSSAKSRETCAFGPTFTPSKSSTFKTVPNQNFNISYGDMEFLNGIVATDNVAVAGMTVKAQTIGVVNLAAWEGDGFTSGILGLANPDLTKTFTGTDLMADTHDNKAVYDPLFFSAVKQGAVPQPYFSVALDRPSFQAQVSSKYDGPLGHIAFGGIANVPTLPTQATLPVQTLNVDLNNQMVNAYLWYLVKVDSYTFPGSISVTTSGTAIVDTGTAINYVPTEVAAAYNAKFNPPATLDTDSDTYFVSCTAVAPPFSVVLGGKSFTIAPVDMIIPSGVDTAGKTQCISGVQDGGTADEGAIFVLGDVFLHNVVATFNIKTNAVTITQRAPY